MHPSAPALGPPGPLAPIFADLFSLLREGAAFLDALIAYARLPWELCARVAYLLVVTRQPDGSTRLQGARMAANDVLCEDFTPLPVGAGVFCNLFYAAWQVLKKRTCTKDST